MVIADAQASEKQFALSSAPMTSVQPGGGLCMRLELAWGRLRRAGLRTCRPGYVRRMLALRQGDCPDCPHDVIDPRDLKFYRNVCGYWFRAEDDKFRWRDRLSLTRYGLAEVVIFSTAFAALLAGLVASYLAGLSPWVFWPLTTIVALLWIQTIAFFRDPERTPPPDTSTMVAPADGTVTDITELDESDFPGGRALRVGIFLSVFNVHVNRSPCAARVLRVRYFPGKFLDARCQECQLQNEQLWIDLEEIGTQRPLRVKQISGAIARRIVCWLKAGDMLRAGERFGMIKFGSRTELYVPATPAVHVAVQPGHKVKGGETILLRTEAPGP